MRFVGTSVRWASRSRQCSTRTGSKRGATGGGLVSNAVENRRGKLSSGGARFVGGAQCLVPAPLPAIQLRQVAQDLRLRGCESRRRQQRLFGLVELVTIHQHGRQVGVGLNHPWIKRDRPATRGQRLAAATDRKSTRLNSSHSQISYAVFCLKKKKNTKTTQ